VSAGWWSDTRNGVLHSPFDPGVGASYRAVPRLRLLGGVHHVSERVDPVISHTIDRQTGPNPWPGLEDSALIRRGQGTYLDGGFLFDLPSSSHVALSIESNHTDSSAPPPLLTLSTGVAF